MTNFTVTDILQTTIATFAFTMFLLSPGYVLGEASNVFGMRTRSGPEKLLLGVVLSFAATPILATSLLRFVSYTVTLSLFVLLAGIAITLAARRSWHLAGSFFPMKPGTWQFLAALFALFLLVQFSLVDWQIGHRLYLSYTVYDQSIRVPLVESAARTGVPPLNPFYAIGTIPSLHYFYYWYVVCALPMRLLGISAKACFTASAFWSGVGMFAAIPLFLKYVLEESENLRRKSLIGIALLGVTGFDLIPYMILSLPPGAVARADMEWWSPNQVTSWLGALLWVPHHVAALVACMAGLLLFSQIDNKNSLRQRTWLVGISAIAFASAAGLSLYVTFSFALFVVYFTLTTLARRDFSTFLTYLATGAVTFLLSWPYLLELYPRKASISSSLESSPSFASIGLREGARVVDPFLWFHPHNILLAEFAKLPALVITYFLEFGFFALVLILALRNDLASSQPLSRQRRMLWTMCAVCLIGMTFLRSDAAEANDLGIRGILVVQFVLLILAAPLLHDVFSHNSTSANSRFSLVRVSLLFTLFLGIAGTAYQLLALRFYAPLADAGRVTRDENFLGAKGFGERTYWLREGFARLEKLIAPSAHVQYDPSREEYKIVHIYSKHQAAMGDGSCVSAFGGDLQTCRNAFPSFFMVFNGAEVMRTHNLDAFCDQYHLNVLVADDVDPVWDDHGSWVWTRPALVSNPYFRAIPCGSASHDRNPR